MFKLATKKDKIEEIASARGYSLHYTSNNYSHLGFTVYPSTIHQTKLAPEEQDNKQGIHLQVFPETDEFILSYNCGTLTLTTGKCGSFSNTEHFSRLENELIKRVVVLKEHGLG